MYRRLAAVLLASTCLLAACKTSGELYNPLVKSKPFAATAVPADFAIVIDENHDTFTSRQHIQQVITAADAMSRTTYTTYRDYNNSISERFTQETPLTASQLQAMWNSTSEHNLLRGASVWINWLSGADLYKRNAYTIQVRANGMERTYRQTNGFSGVVRPIMFHVESVRLPISKNAEVPVVIAPAEVPPATAPATAPATSPATTPS